MGVLDFSIKSVGHQIILLPSVKNSDYQGLNAKKRAPSLCSLLSDPPVFSNLCSNNDHVSWVFYLFIFHYMLFWVYMYNVCKKHPHFLFNASLQKLLNRDCCSWVFYFRIHHILSLLNSRPVRFFQLHVRHLKSIFHKQVLLDFLNTANFTVLFLSVISGAINKIWHSSERENMPVFLRERELLGLKSETNERLLTSKIVYNSYRSRSV